MCTLLTHYLGPDIIIDVWAWTHTVGYQQDPETDLNTKFLNILKQKTDGKIVMKL